MLSHQTILYYRMNGYVHTEGGTSRPGTFPPPLEFALEASSYSNITDTNRAFNGNSLYEAPHSYHNFVRKKCEATVINCNH